MYSRLNAIVRAGYRYNYHVSPDIVQSWDDAERHGLNCGALVHLLIWENFGTRLPSHLMCHELRYDCTYFRYCDINNHTWQLGDVIFVGRAAIAERLRTYVPVFGPDGLILNINDHPHLHLAFCTGESDDNGDPLFIHAINSGVQNWSLSRFNRSISYRKLYCIRRLKIAG